MIAGRSPNILTRRLVCSVLIVLTIYILWYYCAAMYGDRWWSDPVGYAVTGRSLVTEGHFPYQCVPYEVVVTSGTDSYGTSMAVYPNLGFMLASALIGLARGNFSVLNAVYLNLLFSMAVGLALFIVSLKTTQNLLTACLVSILVMVQVDVFPFLASPLTDLSLVFFVPVAAWCMMKGKASASGIILGAAFLFREQAAFFVPFLLFLYPGLSFSLHGFRANLTVLLRYVLWFLLFLAMAKAGQYYFLKGSLSQDFYIDALSGRFLVSFQRVLNFTRNVNFLLTERYLPLLLALLVIVAKRFAANRSGLVSFVLFVLWLCVAVALCYNVNVTKRYLLLLVPVYFLFDAPIRRSSLILWGISLTQVLVLCALWSYKDAVPSRYFASCLALCIMGLFFILADSRYKNILALCVGLFLLLMPGASTLRDVRGALKDDALSFSTVALNNEFPMTLGKAFPENSVFLGYGWYLAKYAVASCIPSRVPDFHIFVANNNKNVAGILLQCPGLGWDGRAVVEDAYGNRFNRMILPERMGRTGNIYYLRSKE